ncbi:hypothetical protein SK128_025811 [Halocaridina rubra]|uniref:Uncharacterized protein n=1 Tax=Halocaridina rubra TaxID=373956 RepID=A0AAN8WU63_HALRR
MGGVSSSVITTRISIEVVLLLLFFSFTSAFSTLEDRKEEKIKNEVLYSDKVHASANEENHESRLHSGVLDIPGGKLSKNAIWQPFHDDISQNKYFEIKNMKSSEDNYYSDKKNKHLWNVHMKENKDSNNNKNRKAILASPFSKSLDGALERKQESPPMTPKTLHTHIQKIFSKEGMSAVKRKKGEKHNQQQEKERKHDHKREKQALKTRSNFRERKKNSHMVQLREEESTTEDKHLTDHKRNNVTTEGSHIVQSLPPEKTKQYFDSRTPSGKNKSIFFLQGQLNSASFSNFPFGNDSGKIPKIISSFPLQNTFSEDHRNFPHGKQNEGKRDDAIYLRKNRSRRQINSLENGMPGRNENKEERKDVTQNIEKPMTEISENSNSDEYDADWYNTWKVHSEDGKGSVSYRYPSQENWGGGWHMGEGDMGNPAPDSIPGDYIHEYPGYDLDLEQPSVISNHILNPQINGIVQGTNRESGHQCWVTDHRDIECLCWGPEFKQIPSNLSEAVQQITIMEAGLETLLNNSFMSYQETLRDIVLSGLKNFHKIEAGTFKQLSKLRSVYIHSAPLLKFMPSLTTEDNSNLKSLRIVSSGLERVPKIHFTGSKTIFHLIELDSNRIKKLESGSLQVRVEQLSLNYNQIETVEKEAFSGSYIGKLSLKGNTKLTYLDEEAFGGIGSLRTLDLSDTSITSLPTSGLNELEVLLLENTPSLKVFPSVYSFKTIKEAHLTYPYHCCAFQFPEQHDRETYISHQLLQKAEQEHCSDLTTPSSTSVTANTRVRKRRQAAYRDMNSHSTRFQNSQNLHQVHKRERIILKDYVDYERKIISPSVNGESNVEGDNERWSKDNGVILTDIGSKIRETKRSFRRDNTEATETLTLTGDKSTSYSQTKRSFRGDNTEATETFILTGDTSTSHSQTKHINNMRKNIFRESRNVEDPKTSRERSHSQTRHLTHRSKHMKSKYNISSSPDTDVAVLIQEDLISQPPDILKQRTGRKHESSRVPHLEGRHTSDDTVISVLSKEYLDNQTFIPSPRKSFETVPDESPVSVAGDSFEPMPEKRFGEDESPTNQEGHLDENFYGIGIGGGNFPNYYQGFGSFNHTSSRYPSTDIDSVNDTHHGSRWGMGQNLPVGSGPPLDSEGPLHPVGFPDFHDGGFVDEAGFPHGGFFDNHPKDNGNQHIEYEDRSQWHPPSGPMNNTVIIVQCGNLSKNYHDVICVPAPDAFNPCEDIMGNLALRVAVWFVVVTAVVGNLAVMLVLVSSKFR